MQIIALSGYINRACYRMHVLYSIMGYSSRKWINLYFFIPIFSHILSVFDIIFLICMLFMNEIITKNDGE